MVTLGIAYISATNPAFMPGGLYLIAFVLDLALISMIYAAVTAGKGKDED